MARTQSLERKFIKKTEYFVTDCYSSLESTLFEKLDYECNPESFNILNC